MGVEAVADAELVMEAEILPHVREPEGPFGEVSGYYATRADRWVVRIKHMSMRRDPIISTLHPGKEVWNGQGLGIEANLFRTISRQVKGLKNVYMTHGGSHYHVVLQMDPPANGMAKNAIMAAFAAFSDLQMVTVVNSDVNIFDAEDVERALCTAATGQGHRYHPRRLRSRAEPRRARHVAAKMGFDCTYPVPKPPEYTRVSFMDVEPAKYEIV